MRLIVFLLLLWNSTAHSQSNTDARALYNKMMLATENVNTCTYVMTLEERIFDKYATNVLLTKVQMNPFKVYVYSMSPDPGAEVLYLKGENNDRVLINPNSFPYININLSPYNSLFRKNHQYTIEQMGFKYLHDILRSYEAHDKDVFYRKLFINNDASSEGLNYYILEINNTDFGFINYKVLKGESITDIANKFKINDQMILDYNRDVSYYDEVLPGKVLSIPNSFGKKIVFYVDKKTFLPLTQIIYDGRGLFSKLIFSEFVLNPIIPKEEFTRHCKKYKF